MLNGRGGNPEIDLVKQYGEALQVECYSSLLDQVFMNLLVNAIDAIEERQQAEADYSGRITITTAIAPGETLRITIDDNGVKRVALELHLLTGIHVNSAPHGRIFNDETGAGLEFDCVVESVVGVGQTQAATADCL